MSLIFEGLGVSLLCFFDCALIVRIESQLDILHVFLIVELKWNGLVRELDDLLDALIASASTAVFMAVVFGTKMSKTYFLQKC